MVTLEWEGMIARTGGSERDLCWRRGRCCRDKTRGRGEGADS